MTDVHTPAQRSYNMSRVRSKDTKPELIVRKFFHGAERRFDTVSSPRQKAPRQTRCSAAQVQNRYFRAWQESTSGLVMN
jgi:G:T-mismatch repair DNA endonuclease (very short patch repair protein)